MPPCQITNPSITKQGKRTEAHVEENSLLPGAKGKRFVADLNGEKDAVETATLMQRLCLLVSVSSSLRITSKIPKEFDPVIFCTFLTA